MLHHRYSSSKLVGTRNLKIRLDARCILHNAILLSAILYLCEFIGQIFEKIREIRVRDS